MERGTKAPGRRLTPSGPAQFAADSATASQIPADYGKGTVQSSQYRSLKTPTGKYNEGSLVKVSPTSQGTGVVGRPSALAEASKDMAMSGVENPDGTRNRIVTRPK